MKGWRTFLGRAPAEAEETAPLARKGKAEPGPPGHEGAAPGIEALFESLPAGRDHSVLDLGPAAPESLEIYGRHARRIRFADLLAAAHAPKGWNQALAALPPQSEQPYTLIMAWDILDHLHPGEREDLVERLVEVSGVGARLHAIVSGGDQVELHPRRFRLLAEDRMHVRPVGAAHPAHPPILPAEMERLVEPFQVVRAFTLKGGLREYMAVRRDA